MPFFLSHTGFCSHYKPDILDGKRAIKTLSGDCLLQVAGE
jgi:hypothetical protein